MPCDGGMPVEWKIELEADGKVLRVTTTGFFRLEEQERMFEEVAVHAGFSVGLPVLFDNRLLDLSGSDAETMRQSVAIVQRFIGAQQVERLAGLVDAGVNFGVGRQFQLLTEASGGHGFCLFKDEQLALRWLHGEPA